MKKIEKNIRLYVAGWNETTPEAIKAAFGECCIQEVTYTDKTTPQFTGLELLVGLVMESYTKVPGRTFSLLTEPECFEGKAYYTWGLHLPDKAPRPGHDFLEYNEDGLITRIVGFLPVS